MRAHALLGATAVVLAAHAALLLALARPGSPPVAASVGSRGAPIIVLVDARRQEGLPATSARATSPESTGTRERAVRPPGPGAGEGGRPAPMPPASAPGHPSTAIGIYRAAAALDVPVRARSAPDITALAGLPWSGLPLRLRLFIDDAGDVVDAQILQSAEADDVAERVRRMFLATGFTAGLQGGRPVPSYKDIELTIGAPS